MRWKNEWTTPTIVGVISFGIGAGVGYAFARYKSKIVYTLDTTIETTVEDNEDKIDLYDLEDIARRMNEGLHTAYNMISELENKEGVETVSHQTQDIADSVYAALNYNTSVEDPEPESESVFPDKEEDWSYEEELKTRTPEAPYIIHSDEYYMEDNGYSQSTLTYYAGDEVLTDTDDTPIYDAKQLVGELIFGKGSDDPNVVHIRNDKLEAEYEVLLDHGHYQVEVLGQEIEDILNSEKSVVPKFRAE